MYTITSTNKKRTNQFTAQTLSNAKEYAQILIYQAMAAGRKITVCIFDSDGRRLLRECI